MNKHRKLGIVRYIKGKTYLSAWLEGYENASWGWEYGNDLYKQSTVWVTLYLFGIRWLHFETSKNWYHIAFLGFWIVK